MYFYEPQFTFVEICLGLIDTDREREIGLGQTYPFQALAAGECLVPALYEKKGLKIGSTVTMSTELGPLI